jgi:predicted HNH restriction endonuclease
VYRVSVQCGKQVRKFFSIGELNSKTFGTQLSNFVHEVKRIKELISIVGKTIKNVSNSDPAIEGFEGNLKNGKAHLVKERDNSFRNRYRTAYSHIVKCPACKIDPKKKYRLKNPNRFLELHHIVPLKYINKKIKITAGDVTLLCPNCHRAIHRLMSTENKKTISLQDFKNRL